MGDTFVEHLATSAGWTMQPQHTRTPHFEILACGLASVDDASYAARVHVRTSSTSVASEIDVKLNEDNDASTEKRTTIGSSSNQARSTNTQNASDWSASASSTTFSSMELSRAASSFTNSGKMSPRSRRCHTPSYGESPYADSRTDETSFQEQVCTTNNSATLPGAAHCQMEMRRRYRLVGRMKQGVRRVFSLGILSARREPMEEVRFDASPCLLKLHDEASRPQAKFNVSALHQAETIATIAAGPQKARARKQSRPRTALGGPLESLPKTYTVSRFRRPSSSTSVHYFASRQKGSS